MLLDYSLTEAFDILTNAANIYQPNLVRVFHESLTTTMDMGVLSCVLGCYPLRRTHIPVWFGINTLHAAQAPALRAVARWHAHLYGLVTAIHERSGLARWEMEKVCFLGSMPGLILRSVTAVAYGVFRHKCQETERF